MATPDGEIADRVRMLRFHGSKDKVDFHFVGCNSRLDEIQATALRLFLPQLDGWNRGRREAAERYRELGLGEHVDTPVDEPGHVYHLFVSRSPERDAIVAALKEQQIGCATYYVTPLHLQPALRFLGYEEGSLPETERAARENFSIPLWPGIAPETQELVVEAVKTAAAAKITSRDPFTASRLAALCRRGARRRSLVPRVPAALRQRRPGLLRDAVRADDPDRRRDQARRLRPLRPLQPLVALRVDARHVADRPRRRGRLPRRRPDRLPDQPGRPRPAAALDRGDRPLAPDADAGCRRPPPRSLDHGAAVAARDHRAREGGARRRRRRRRAADRPRDAQVAGARLHPDRPGRRRPAQEEPPSARRARARARPTTCLGSCASRSRTRC